MSAAETIRQLAMLRDRVASPGHPLASLHDKIAAEHRGALGDHVEALRRISDHPEQPAPRYYAAMLLAELGERDRLLALATCDMPVVEVTGDAERRVSLGEAVRRFLTDEERAALPDPPPPGGPPPLEDYDRTATFFDKWIVRLFG